METQNNTKQKNNFEYTPEIRHSYMVYLCKTRKGKNVIVEYNSVVNDIIREGGELIAEVHGKDFKIDTVEN